MLKLCGWSALAAPLPGQRVVGANDTVRLGVIGCGGRALGLVEEFARVKQVAIVGLCDADTGQIGCLAREAADRHVELGGVAREQDYRKLLERADIDAVVIASPNHWHTLHAIEAMRAGKDVYVEKPVSHSLWEGRQLVAAERKYGRVVAAGLQNRSDAGPREAFRHVREGHLGRVVSIHVCCFRERQGIGRREQALKPPASVDYNLWLGPAADVPILRDQFHYDWHWVWNTGNGEIGNQTPHEIDMANWVAGDGPLPTAVRSIGGRFGWDDAGETPNLHTVWYELGGIPVTVEVNDLQLTPARKVAGIRDGIRVGLLVRCEGGELRGGRGGFYIVGPDGKRPARKFPGDGGAAHAANFIDAVRSRRRETIAADVVKAERAAAIAHLANISHRSGEAAGPEAVDEAVGANETVRRVLHDQAKQLADWGIERPAYTLGKAVAIDPAAVAVTTPGINPRLIRREDRREFAVPEVA